MDKITVERDIDVEMRDGITLATDIYRPQGAENCPTLVHRNPYDKSNAGSVGGLIVNPLDAAREGFAVVVQDTRGRFESEGEWIPFVNEADDGYDTVEWAADRPWSNGRVGIYGASYHGVTALQAVTADPPHLEAALAYLTGANYHDGWVYSDGAFELGFNLWWTQYLATDTVTRLDLPEADRDAELDRLLELTADPESVAAERPLAEGSLFSHPATTYVQDWFDHPTYDEYWTDIDVLEGIEDVETPVLHASGWYDLFLRSHLSLYQAIVDRGGERAREEQRFIVGPWDHEAYATLTPDRAGDRKFGYEAAGGTALMSDLSLQWFGHWLADRDDIEDIASVRYYQMGTNEWRTAESWPPEHSETRYYLHSDGGANTRSGSGRLTPHPPAAEPADSYEYDPTDPVPSVGGRSLHISIDDPGIKDRADVEERDDILVYTSARLTDSLEIAGPVAVTLYASSSAPDTDFTATLVDVEPDATCVPIAEGIQRARYRESPTEVSFIEPGEIYEFSIDLQSVAHTFRTGHRLRLEVSSSNFPRFDRNPNTTAAPVEASPDDVQAATQNIFHTDEYPSHLTLPVRD
ncbi:MAG: CocE/NonD family hydrolase [Natronomonas sp.]